MQESCSIHATPTCSQPIKGRGTESTLTPISMAAVASLRQLFSLDLNTVPQSRHLNKNMLAKGQVASSA